MQAVWVVARCHLRRRAVATIALVVVVGVAGGVVLAALAGASRTDSAMRRFVAFSRPEDVYVVVNGPSAAFGAGGLSGPPTGVTPEQEAAYAAATMADRQRLVHLPEVADAGRSPYLFMSPDRAGDQLGAINPFAAADTHEFRTTDRPRVIAGRLARTNRADEAVVDDVTARLRHVRVGSSITLYSFSAEQNTNVALGGFGKLPAPDGPAYTFRIVGIVREPSTVSVPPPSIVDNAIYEGSGGMYLTPAFLQQFADDQGQPLEALPGIEGFRIRLRHGLADFPSFSRQLAALDIHPADVHIGSDVQQAADKVQRAIHLEAVALVLFALLAALAGILIVGQAVGREVLADAVENGTLAALGTRRRHLIAIPLVRAGVIALGGAVVAVGVAFALSPLTPLGLARRAEIRPGFSWNTAVLLGGSAMIALVTILRAFLPAWRAAVTHPAAELIVAPARPGRIGATLAGSPLGPAAVAGMGMSLERRRGVTARTALAGSLVAVVGAVAAGTFGLSLRHLIDSPVQQGWNWDVVVGNPNTQPYEGDPAADPLHAKMVDQLARNHLVRSFAGFGSTDGVTLDGQLVNIFGLEHVAGTVGPRVVEGRSATSDDEIVLGRSTLRLLHRRVGQTVAMRSGENVRTMRIVGTALVPTAGDLSARLATGAFVTIGGLRSVAPDTPVLEFMVRFAPGADRAGATRSLVADFGREVLAPYPGGEVGDLAQVQSLPDVLVAFLVALAVASLGLALVSSTRHHRRDLAVLKTVGFIRRQVAATMAWQATSVIVVALAVGIPLGFATGRVLWDLVAGGLGSVAPPVVPLVSVALAVPATLAIANALAAWPGWTAGRVRASEALRAE